MQIIRAFGVNTFVYDKVFTVFLGKQRVGTMRTTKLKGRESAVLRREFGRADATEELSFGTFVFIEKRFRCIASWVGAVVRNITFRPAFDRANFLTLTLFKVRDEIFVIPVLPKVGDQRVLINHELLIFGRMGTIKSPLLKRDISADKVN